jgi:hypothetical protein
MDAYESSWFPRWLLPKFSLMFALLVTYDDGGKLKHCLVPLK